MSTRDVDLKKHGIIPEPGLTHLSVPFLPMCFQICVGSEFEETVTGHYFRCYQIKRLFIKIGYPVGFQDTFI